ncbi:MAG: hypothetical protein CVU64_07260 [Deltaproteobacteria bacterium HGW-Deltaproteobacteria-21]|nr:MAG: hypothetical protein CVU64_07260 [Deltaproteobacteria bacterium HGW-Deltaproteobacteria-21]
MKNHKSPRSIYNKDRIILPHSVIAESVKSASRYRIPAGGIAAGHFEKHGITTRQECCDTIGDQNGSVLVIALLILVFLTLIGIASSSITQIEIQIAGNERAYNIAFNTADSGVYMSPKIIRRCFEDGAQPTLTNINCTPASPGFFRRVMGYDPPPNNTGNVQFTLDNQPVSVAVKRDRQISLGGGGIEFGSGTEGVGVGSASGVAVIYKMDSDGTGPNSAKSVIAAEYRLVPGVAGGL